MKFNVKKTTDTDNTQNEEFYTDADMAASADDDAAMSDIDFGFEDQVSDEDAQNDALLDMLASDVQSMSVSADDESDDDESDEEEENADADDAPADTVAEAEETAPVSPAPVKPAKTKTVKTKATKTKSKTAKTAGKQSDIITVAFYSTDDDDIDITTYSSQEEAVKAVIMDFTKVLSSPEVFNNLDGDVVFNTEKTVIKTTDGKKIWKIKA